MRKICFYRRSTRSSWQCRNEINQKTPLPSWVVLPVSRPQLCPIGFSGRFQKEARAIAALNHTNIATLFDIGPDYLVMEFIEGETLADRILRGGIPLDEALAIARQIADAHQQSCAAGITHP